ncbi:MAG: riboflavin synthase [Oscillospiraceae bacterium]|nr:riboflavin synthase [Oscillospiraceae bacterium]
MFTGIIEEVGEISEIRRGAHSCSLSVKGSLIFDDIKLGDSIAVNGVCLTAADIKGNIFMADVTPETMRRTALGTLKTGSRVNLERAMSANGRFGGHIVSGHIDGTGIMRSLIREDNSIIVTIGAESNIMRYIIEKGSVAVNGISLTVAKLYKDAFSISLIPHTAEQTTLFSTKPGDRVNLECDIVGKYIEKLIGKESGITEDFLREYDF